jgi:membrane-bound serine protease (ClpP class)
MRRTFMAICGFWLLAALYCSGAEKRVGVIQIDGAIGPAIAGYIERAIDISSEREDASLIIRLDTPGGLVSSTEDIVASFYGSVVPVVVYVAPSGSSATSAGTFITMAADIAAMAPNTRIGAAHPVGLGISGGNSTNDVMSTKAENDTTSMIINIAEKRGRNAEWAESAVRESVSITSEEALDLKVIDLIAKDIPDLLDQIDGRTVREIELKTRNAEVVEIPMLAREKLFTLIWTPEVLWILMLVAVYGILGEVSNPGAIFPGTIGAIALLLLLYMSSVLPVNITGYAFIALAIVLFVVDVFAPTHGVLTAGGIISFALGGLMLFNKGVPGFELSVVYIIPGVLMTAAFFIFVVGKGLRAQILPVRAGRETLIGQVTTAVDAVNSTGGRVFIEGEYWRAVSDVPIEAGQPVEVVAVERLTLKVKPKL